MEKYDDLQNLSKIKLMMRISGILAIVGVFLFIIPIIPLFKFINHLAGMLLALIGVNKCVDEGLFLRMFWLGSLAIVHFVFLSASAYHFSY